MKRREIKYKGYTIVVEREDGKWIIYPTHPIHDLNDDDGSSCPSIDDCRQWIDADIRCRREEST